MNQQKEADNQKEQLQTDVKPVSLVQSAHSHSLAALHYDTKQEKHKLIKLPVC